MKSGAGLPTAAGVAPGSAGSGGLGRLRVRLRGDRTGRLRPVAVRAAGQANQHETEYRVSILRHEGVPGASSMDAPPVRALLRSRRPRWVPCLIPTRAVAKRPVADSRFDPWSVWRCFLSRWPCPCSHNKRARLRRPLLKRKSRYRSHSRGPPGCGSESDLAGRIAWRTNRVRFVPVGASERHLDVTLELAERSATATLELTLPNGRRATRVFRAATCDEAVDAAALVAAVTLDPTASTSPTTPPPDAGAPDAAQRGERAERTRAPRPSRRRPNRRVEAEERTLRVRSFRARWSFRPRSSPDLLRARSTASVSAQWAFGIETR